MTAHKSQSVADGIRAGLRAWPKPPAPAPVAPAPTAAPSRPRKRMTRTYRASALPLHPIFAGRRAGAPMALPTARADPGVGRPDRIIEGRGRQAAWGAEAVLARLRGLGVTVELTPDKAHIVALVPGGRIVPELAAAIEAWAPLLRAHLAKEPLACAFCGAPAVAPLIGGAVSCRYCMGEPLGEHWR